MLHSLFADNSINLSFLSNKCKVVFRLCPPYSDADQNPFSKCVWLSEGRRFKLNFFPPSEWPSGRQANNDWNACLSDEVIKLQMTRAVITSAV